MAYRAERIESQIRLLADTCLVMQDYDGALANYKLARVRARAQSPHPCATDVLRLGWCCVVAG